MPSSPARRWRGGWRFPSAIDAGRGADTAEAEGRGGRLPEFVAARRALSLVHELGLHKSRIRAAGYWRRGAQSAHGVLED